MMCAEESAWENISIQHPTCPHTVASMPGAFCFARARAMDRKGLRGGAEDIESAGEMVGRVHSIDSFTAVDGHGIRLIAFLQGCRKRCAFCCNVDSTNASASKGMVMTVDGVLSKLARNRKYYAASGGGLTLSGGECLLQPDFVKALATGSKALGLTTAIDTAAEGNETVWNEILPHVDIVLLCVKSTNRAKYHRITGTDADEYDTMRNFLRELDRRKIDTWLRFVLMTDDDERFQQYRTNDADELRDLAALAKSHDGCVRGVELLPYHRFGVYKFAELGLEYKLDGMKTPTMDEIQRAVDFLRAEGVTVVY